jgi:hypothetical protein
MLITRTSCATGVTRTIDLPVTQEQLDRYYDGNEKIQSVFPNLSAGEREFILTGITDEEWEDIFRDDEPAF